MTSPSVPALPSPPDRECPKCGKRYTQQEIDQARRNFYCTCNEARYSDFIQVKYSGGLKR